MKTPRKQDKRNRRRTAVITLGLIVLFAYATQVTNINLEEPLEPKRQENLVNLIRRLAHPDLFTYDDETRSTNATIRMPCPDEVKGSQVNIEGRQVLMIPNCATTTQDQITMKGEGFRGNADGRVVWYPIGSTTTRRVSNFKVTPEGTFEVTFTMPDIRPTEVPQRLEIVEITNRRITGLSDTSREAFDKIIETVLMALMASTIGTILAVPFSFIAARNLMAGVKAPLAAIMSVIILTPIIGGAGWWLTNQLLGSVAQTNGAFVSTLRDSLAFAGFVGNFIVVLTNLLLLLLPLAAGFVGLLLAITLGGRYGQEAIMRLPNGPARLLTAVLTTAGTAIFAYGLFYALSWINVIGLREHLPESEANWLSILGTPALTLGLIAGLASLRTQPKYHFPVGMITYTVTRGTFNGLRAIEPLMLGFVFVVWIGLGPFAGIMALTLNSVADLGKLFSEQVENIDDGPVEAITATGGNFVQTIVYAVVPQITPHYIAYIFYRWDINVRMSTIIGFVGGGGIGFVLQRNINQVLYTRASVMVIAIAVVIIVLDTVSARVRRRII